MCIDRRAENYKASCPPSSVMSGKQQPSLNPIDLTSNIPKQYPIFWSNTPRFNSIPYAVSSSGLMRRSVRVIKFQTRSLRSRQSANTMSVGIDDGVA